MEEIKNSVENEITEENKEIPKEIIIEEKKEDIIEENKEEKIKDKQEDIKLDQNNEIIENERKNDVKIEEIIEEKKEDKNEAQKTIEIQNNEENKEEKKDEIKEEIVEIKGEQKGNLLEENIIVNIEEKDEKKLEEKVNEENNLIKEENKDDINSINNIEDNLKIKEIKEKNNEENNLIKEEKKDNIDNIEDNLRIDDIKEKNNEDNNLIKEEKKDDIDNIEDNLRIEEIKDKNNEENNNLKEEKKDIGDNLRIEDIKEKNNEENKLIKEENKNNIDNIEDNLRIEEIRDKNKEENNLIKEDNKDNLNDIEDNLKIEEITDKNNEESNAIKQENKQNNVEEKKYVIIEEKDKIIKQEKEEPKKIEIQREDKDKEKEEKIVPEIIQKEKEIIIDKEKEKKDIIKEKKQDLFLDEFLNFDKEDIKNELNSKQKNKDVKDKKDSQYNLTEKEIAKLQEVFFNSFTTELVSERKQKKKDKETEDNFIILENDLPYNEEMHEDNDNENNGQKKRYEDIFKFRQELNLKKKLKKFNLFYYTCKNPNEDKIIYKLGKTLVYTYRKNFPKIKNYKTNKTYTTDAWWGCMVRCGQMILSRGIYRLLKSKGLDTKKALYFTVPLFSNYPIRKENLHPFFEGMIKKYKNYLKMDDTSEVDIKDFYPPFAIKTLCDVGELYERTAGEWFSDVIITAVFKKISEYYDLFNHPKLNVKIMTYQSCIEIQDILDTCFVEKKFDKNNHDYIHFHEKYYYFDKMGIVFVNVRVGLDKIPKDYYDGIKKLFTLKECIGIIGGKTRLAYYFIGYNNEDDTLLYLDPHVTKEADKVINMGNILSKHVNKEIHLLKLSKMSTAFTIGFCFRNYEEFLSMYEFWLKAKQDALPILGIVKQNIVYAGKDMFEEEDFSPTYEDKDEDDF